VIIFFMLGATSDFLVFNLKPQAWRDRT